MGEGSCQLFDGYGGLDDPTGSAPHLFARPVRVPRGGRRGKGEEGSQLCGKHRGLDEPFGQAADRFTRPLRVPRGGRWGTGEETYQLCGKYRGLDKPYGQAAHRVVRQQGVSQGGTGRGVVSCLANTEAFASPTDRQQTGLRDCKRFIKVRGSYTWCKGEEGKGPLSGVHPWLWMPW